MTSPSRRATYDLRTVEGRGATKGKKREGGKRRESSERDAPRDAVLFPSLVPVASPCPATFLFTRRYPRNSFKSWHSLPPRTKHLSCGEQPSRRQTSLRGIRHTPPTSSAWRTSPSIRRLTVLSDSLRIPAASLIEKQCVTIVIAALLYRRRENSLAPNARIRVYQASQGMRTSLALS